MSTLVITSPEGTSLHEPGTDVTIGRDPQSTVSLSSPVVSRTHGVVRWHDGMWVYTDTGSSLGSWVDGRREREVRLAAPLVLELGTGERAVSLRMRVQAARPAQRPGGVLAERIDLDGTVVREDQLAIECGGQTYRLRAGDEAVVGRADDADIHCQNPTVSRHHAVIRQSGTGWELVDTDSASGTFVDGRRMPRVELVGSTEVMLGDPRAGERLVAAAAGERPLTWQHRLVGRARNDRRVMALAAAAALVLVSGSGWGLVSVLRPPGEPNLDRLARATVRVITDQGRGSGTIIDAERGLVLTNAHVAAPDALGRGARTEQFADALGAPVKRITLAVAAGLDREAAETYVAEVAAVDGYLDLAVLRITARVDGKPLGDNELHDLQALPMGRSADVNSGDPVWVVGFPGLAESDAATYTKGVISSTVRDKRLKSAASLFNSDVRVNPGNSGGLGANVDGELVAVPSLNKQRRSDSLLAGLVPVDLARPLVDKARARQTYTSPWYAAASSAEKLDLDLGPAGSGPGIAEGCTEGRATTQRLIALQVSYRGLIAQEHQDVLVAVSAKDGTGTTLLGQVSSGAQYPLRLAESGCFTATVDLGEDLSPGVYVIRVGMGPNHRVIGTLTLTLR